ncbi:phosphoribosylglycinamide formyltransferase [Bibersteinia trehalosi Y31]|uniref:Phosphoribosylglycinamide formyltransferase n=1 Tax=Bibersteinia trehalosi Y31 TaxID=1261658 RepID=A0A179CZV8_BIBTR|nr:phosphoribosylglycinamide formyltransferase [Bibersteinia trehalosi]OAQ15107.1 phosphoribosylglycinamide formyltransferase [Bibersteinia trehalosi Y31]
MNNTNLALFASGNGSNVQAIIQAVQNGDISANIACIVCDQPQAYVIERAKLANIDCFVLSRKGMTRPEWEQQVVAYLQPKQINLVVLAGFMRILGNTMLDAYPNQIINIHPSLLPAFGGTVDAIGEAYRAGVSQTGVTIHWVDSGVDTGEIIAQQALAIDPNWTQDQLANEIHKIEHQLYPKTIQQIVSQR